MVAGDINVKSEEWFASHTNRKEAIPSEFSLLVDRFQSFFIEHLLFFGGG